ncbi:radical SAM protein [Rhodocytophaga rosea]|uniref:Radical SAM protein n=1 Tax=Rhodocytophaga rosea TaxID=2704465 RepID=A0A6C0GI73_9BACT|nr:radical SAM protein [Rhodocytophaga rosea]QHT67659.1 radical SAM protein [Rhodocytophaga rosea]
MRNQQKKAESDQELNVFRQQKWQLYMPVPHKPWFIEGKQYLLRPGLTFTPFANAVACNAHCAFCSEELLRDQHHQLTAKQLIRDYPSYFSRLQEVLAAFKGFPLGLSVSGLEPTADRKWLLHLLETIQQAEKTGVIFDEKVIYTNGSGLSTHPDLIQALLQNRFDRIELSRCHFDETVNQQIMRFNRNQPVWRNAAFEKLVSDLPQAVHLKLSCILTKTGIRDIISLEKYLQWVARLGVKEVVFREMSRLNGTYQLNTFSAWVEKNRVPIEPLLSEVVPILSRPRTGWQYAYSTFGYYYYNEHFRWNDQIEVIFETSSYEALQAANTSQVIQKLVFHSNGNLTGDWDPNAKLVMPADKSVLI